MKKFYTVGYRLTVKRKDGTEELLDVQTQEFAYNTRENAYKELQTFKKDILSSDTYKPTTNEFRVVKRTLDQIYIMDFEIKEHWLSVYEEKES